MIHSNFVRILLMEANAVTSPLDITPLSDLFVACMSSDPEEVRKFTTHGRPHVRGAANFIMRQHDFAVQKAKSQGENHVSQSAQA